MGSFRSADVCQLLHNKFVIVLGDSIQRAVYKDLVKLLQDDKLLSAAQLKQKGEMTFEKDLLVEGGILDGMKKGTAYREVRQYRSGHHLVRFYFLSRVYSAYLESILSDFLSGPQPDVVIANSCIWDLMRYDNKHLEDYKTNLEHLFLRLKEVLSPECLIIWKMTMPVGYRDFNFQKNTAHNLQTKITEGNFFSSTLADFHKLDVLDMHYHFRFDLRLRCHDAIHWNQLAHRKYSQILLTHIAMAWGVELPKGSALHVAPPHLVELEKNPKVHLRNKKRVPYSQGSAHTQKHTVFNKSNTNYFSGPTFTHHPCAERNFLLPTKVPPINFGTFPSFAPYPQEDWNMKITTRRGLKPREVQTHPYPHPPMYRSRSRYY